MILVYKDDDSDMKNLLFSTAYGQNANGGYFGAPLAIQSVHYDGYHGVL